MARGRLPARVLVLAVFTAFVSPWVCSAASSHPHGNAHKGLFRNKRSACVDGTYEINGRTCCRCAAGQFRVNHCSHVENDTKCSYCEKGTYNSEPNSEASCQLCKSCDHPDAGLEEDEPCTSARNTKCKCYEDHYCESGDCRVCLPCDKCGSEGVQTPCTATQNTVCNGDSDNSAGAIVGSVVAVLVAAALGVGGFLFWKRKRNNQSIPVSDPPEEELPLIDLFPHLPDIADRIGWREMERLAMRSGIKADIDNCKLNNPNDAQTQTLDLLKIWVEKHGKEASRKLIQMLNEHGMRDKAEAIKSILRKESTAASNHSV